jgi:hypothetical protein
MRSVRRGNATRAAEYGSLVEAAASGAVQRSSIHTDRDVTGSPKPAPVRLQPAHWTISATAHLSGRATSAVHSDTHGYGPKVNTNARRPGSAATSVRTCRPLDAPATNRSIPERSKRATPSVPTSAPRASPTGFPSSNTVTAAFPDAPGSITTFTSPAVKGRMILPVPFRSSRYWRPLRQSPSSLIVPGSRRSEPT